MKRSIRSAPGVWHYKTQAQAWRKQLLNHTMTQLPSAAVNNENTNRGQTGRQRNRKAEGAKGRGKLKDKEAERQVWGPQTRNELGS